MRNAHWFDTDDEESSHGEDYTCAGVIETFGALLTHPYVYFENLVLLFFHFKVVLKFPEC